MALLDHNKYDYIRDTYFTGSDSYFYIEMDNVFLHLVPRHNTIQCKFTIFLLAVYEKRVELVEMILNAAMNKKAVLHQRDLYGNQATHIAVLQNYPEVLTALLKNGASKDATNNVTR